MRPAIEYVVGGLIGTLYGVAAVCALLAVLSMAGVVRL